MRAAGRSCARPGDWHQAAQPAAARAQPGGRRTALSAGVRPGAGGSILSAVVTGVSTLRGHEMRASNWITLPRIYTLGLVFWLATRWLVLVHQGAWPWMNAFVVAAARGIVVGDWNDAVRPQLPDLLGVPLVFVGATEQQTVAILYLIASLVQFGAFVVLIRTLFPGRLVEQALALLIFVLVPYNHSIHHYRDVPVVLASSAVFLLSAHFLRTFVRREPGDRGVDARSALWVTGAMLLGVGSRAEVVTFVGVLIVVALILWRRQA